jgi:hypothetical protein
MKNPADLRKLIDELFEAKREYDRLVSDEEGTQQLGPPASSKQIAKLVDILGAPLPPSYRAFLELHNGWRDFDGGAKLLSVEDQSSAWVKARLEQLGDRLFEDDRKNPFLNGAMPVLLGEDEHNYLVLSPRKIHENGEMDFVMYDYSEEEQRFSDFTSFLQHDLDLMRELIDEEKHGVPDEEESEDNEE